MQGDCVCVRDYHRVSSVRLLRHWKWCSGVLEVTLFPLSVWDWYQGAHCVFVNIPYPAWPSAMARLRYSVLTFSQIFYMCYIWTASWIKFFSYFKCFSCPKVNFSKMGDLSRLSGSTVERHRHKAWEISFEWTKALSMFDQSILFYSLKPLIEVLSLYFPTEVIDLYY